VCVCVCVRASQTTQYHEKYWTKHLPLDEEEHVKFWDLKVKVQGHSVIQYALHSLVLSMRCLENYWTEFHQTSALMHFGTG